MSELLRRLLTVQLNAHRQTVDYLVVNAAISTCTNVFHVHVVQVRKGNRLSKTHKLCDLRGKNKSSVHLYLKRVLDIVYSSTGPRQVPNFSYFSLFLVFSF